MKTVGHCRFSYFGHSDTGKSIASLEAAQDLLWNPDRMAVRFHLFKNITLPSIRNQSDPNFLFVIISSEQMPTVYRDRLEALVENDANIRIMWTRKPSINKASRPLMLEASNDGRDPALHFRIDDDDAVSVDYVRMLKNAAQSLEPTSVITFTRGVMGYLDDGVARHRPFRKFGIAIGYGILKAPEDLRSPFAIQHGRYAQAHLGKRDDDFVAFHYTRHSTNNTNGYAAVIHKGGSTNDVIVRNSRIAQPELTGTFVAAPETDEMIKTAFPYTDGPSLRRVIERTLDPVKLP